MSSDHRFQLSPPSSVNTAAPNESQILADLASALAGGDATNTLFYDNLGPLQNLFTTLASAVDEESLWIPGEDDDGNPVYFVENGSDYLEVGARFTDPETVQNGTGSTDDLKVVGVGYVNLVTDQSTSQQIVMTIEYGGVGIAGLIGSALVAKLLKALVKSIITYVTGLIKRAFGRTPVDDPGEAESLLEEDSDDAAEAAGVEGLEVAEGVAIDVGMVVTGVGVVVAVGALALVCIVAILAKPMYNYVKFFNATSIDIQFGICSLHGSTGAQTAPAAVGETVTMPAIGVPAAPPGVTPSGEVISYSDMQFINQDLVAGIGYVLMASPSGDFPGFRVMVDIPTSGDNSLYAAFGTEDCETVWDDQHGQRQQLTMAATSGPYTLQIGTNQLSGESPSPIDKSEGYNYEHLIVLTDGTVDLPS